MEENKEIIENKEETNEEVECEEMDEPKEKTHKGLIIFMIITFILILGVFITLLCLK